MKAILKNRLVRWFATLSVMAIGSYWIVRWQAPDRLKGIGPGHEHCIKCATMPFAIYADAHGGKFPTSERGWGDALVKLIAEPGNENSVAFLVGVDDDGEHLLRALKTGEDVAEEDCTRIYVQGLTKESNEGIALLFDRYAVRGGDHFRSPFGRPLREVMTVDWSHKIVHEEEWPEFVETQRELLLEEGFTEAEIESYYASTLADQEGEQDSGGNGG